MGAPEVAWGIGKSFIKQKTRYKRAESILAMLVCIALEIDYGVSFVLNTSWSEIKSEVASIGFFFFQISKSEVNPNWHEAGTFTPLVILGLDFVS